MDGLLSTHVCKFIRTDVGTKLRHFLFHGSESESKIQNQKQNQKVTVVYLVLKRLWKDEQAMKCGFRRKHFSRMGVLYLDN
jgi:Leu/Phe-tRNA-protein transferase